MADWLEDTQDHDGAWSYGGSSTASNYDHSNTQYAILGLHAASRGGAKVHADTWLKSLRHLPVGPIPDGYRGSMKDYAALKAAGAPVLGWGEFVTVVINFVILAFIIFLLVRWATKLMRRRDETPAGPTEIELLAEIRDELRKR